MNGLRTIALSGMDSRNQVNNEWNGKRRDRIPHNPPIFPKDDDTMSEWPKLFDRLVKNAGVRLPNLLHSRLEEALQHGSNVWLETNSDSFSGVPIHLDKEFVELLALSIPDDEDSEHCSTPYKRTTWLIRLSSIEAVAYPTESWSKDRLETLLGEIEEKRSERDE
jgi:hypothetical protein